MADDSAMSLVAICPDIPYKRKFENGFGVGYQLYISGHINNAYTSPLPSPAPRGFTMDLVDMFDNRMLRVYPRFDEYCVVMNSSEKDKWGEELRYYYYPFHPNVNFTMIITVEPTHYQIYVNNAGLGSMGHRLSPRLVTGIHIEGQLSIHQLFCAKTGRADWCKTIEYTPIPITVNPVYPLRYKAPNVPELIKLPEGISTGMVFAIVGKPHALCDMFKFTWCGPEKCVGLEMTVEFYVDKRYNRIKLNSKSFNQWMVKSRTPNLYFKRGTKFRLFVKLLVTHYEMWINGQHVLNYYHRLKDHLINVNALGLHGDIDIYSAVIGF